MFEGKIQKVIARLVVMLISGVFASIVYAEDGNIENKPPQQKLVKISTLNSIEANQEFQRNVQIMQAQRQSVFNLQAQMEKAHTEELKAELQKKIDAALKKLNDDNQQMLKVYGFSLSRNYVLVVEKAHIYMAVSAEEAEKINKEKKK